MRVALAIVGLGWMLSSCGPPDGVLSWAFELVPGANLVLPPPEELGLKLEAIAFASARATCAADVNARSLVLQVEGLPAIATSPAGPYYRLILLVGDEPIQPRHGALRLLQRLSPISTAFAHGEPQRVELGRVLPSPAGRATLTFTNPAVELANVVGGELEIVVPVAGQGPKTYPVLDGEMGNLANGAAAGPPPSTEDHHH